MLVSFCHFLYFFSSAMLLSVVYSEWSTKIKRNETSMITVVGDADLFFHILFLTLAQVLVWMYRLIFTSFVFLNLPFFLECLCRCECLCCLLVSFTCDFLKIKWLLKFVVYFQSVLQSFYRFFVHCYTLTFVNCGDTSVIGVSVIAFFFRSLSCITLVFSFCFSFYVTSFFLWEILLSIVQCCLSRLISESWSEFSTLLPLLCYFS